MMRILSKCINKNTLRLVYFAYVNSLLHYGIVFWGNSFAAIRCFRMQKKIIRIMEGARPRSSCRPIFHKLEILPLPSLHIFESILLVKRSMCDKNTFYLKNEDIHLHNTRLKSDLFIQQYSTYLCQDGALHSGIKLYNNLPIKIKHLDKLNSFKSALKACSLNHCFYSIKDYLESSLFFSELA